MKNIITVSICKNELSNIDRFINNTIQADKVYILDTGSTDGTYEKLLELQKQYDNLIVSQKLYKEFYFDAARNDALSLVKEDRNNTLVVNIDFDEYFYQSNWCEILRNFIENKRRNKSEEFFVDCLYLDNSDITLDHQKRVITCMRMFCGENFNYQNEIHETIAYKGSAWLSSEIYEFCNEVMIVHEQDGEKSRERYIELGEKRINAKKDNFEKGQASLMTIFEYCRKPDKKKIKKAKDLYNNVKELPVDRSFADVWMYKTTQDDSYLNDLSNIINPDYYDQNITYLLLKELGKNKISKKNLEILQEMFEFNKQLIGEEYFELSEMDQEIEKLLYPKNDKKKNDKKNKK